MPKVGKVNTKPEPCVICQGSGRSTSNYECVPCQGTGVKGGKAAGQLRLPKRKSSKE